jgi:hypothetical protein
MHKRSSARLATLVLACVTAMAATGCVLDEELDEETDVAELDQLDEEPDAELAEVTKPVEPGEASIQVHDYNGICADSLTMRDVPGGFGLCTMSWFNIVYVYNVNGQWAYVRALTGGCEGHVGWALKGYISRLCLR